MARKMKHVAERVLPFRPGVFVVNDSTVQKLPDEIKKRILTFLKAPPPGTVCGLEMIDPITGKCYGMTNILRQKDGFEWSTPEIYMFENYDIRLTEEFLKHVMTGDNQ